MLGGEGTKGGIHTSCNSSSDEDWATTISEHLKGTFTLTLSTITVNGGSREVLVNEEIGQRVCHALGFDENQSKASTVGVEDVKKNRALVHVFNVFDLLSDVLGGGTDTTNRQEDVVFQEVASEHLNVAGEGGGKHESLTVLNTGHILTLDNSADLWFETHVQHTISLIKNQVLDVLERDTPTLNQIDKTTWGSNKEIAPSLDLAELGADVSTTVNNAGSDP